MTHAVAQQTPEPTAEILCSGIQSLSSYQERWEARSSIRTRPRKTIDFSQKGYFFPAEKQPILLLPQIQALGEHAKEDILLSSFYKYLNDIKTLETDLIVQSSLDVLSDRAHPLIYPASIKRDFLTIVVDEFYHVYIAQDLMRQMEDHSPQIQHAVYPLSDAAQAVQTTKKQLDTCDHSLFQLIAVCIFETTLVRELVEFFHSPSVHPSIQYYVNDHMNDEARHYRFFYALLEETWKKLPKDKCLTIGRVLPSFLKQYLDITSDIDFHRMLLQKWLRKDDKVEEALKEIYKGFSVTADIPIVKNVLKVLRTTKISETPVVREGLEKLGWGGAV